MTLRPDYDALSSLSLLTGLVTGGLGLFSLVCPARARAFWSWLPRSVWPGRIFSVIALLWSGLWLCVMPLGPLMVLRDYLFILIPIAIFSVCIFIPELLTCRASGGLLVLIPGPILSAAAWHPSLWRYVLIVYAYVMILAGMYYIGLPWLMRDHITWVHQSPKRARWVASVATGLGLLLVLLAFTAYPVDSIPQIPTHTLH